jgi:hypothetical protein
MPEWDLRKIEPLIAELASGDAFRRLEAIEKLEDLTRMTLGFRFNDPEGERTRAIQRWKDWMEREQREKEQEGKLRAAVELSGGAIDIGALKDAIKEIPAQKLQGYLNAFIMKMKAAQTRCEGCKVRQATVRVTEIDDGETTVRHFCDLCARERGDAFI